MIESDSRFPLASNSYSCESCKRGDHDQCHFRTYAGQGSTWSASCACYDSAKDEHPRVIYSIKISAEDYKRLEKDAQWEGKGIPDYLVDHALGRTRKGC